MALKNKFDLELRPHHVVHKADSEARKLLPELKFGRADDGNYLKKLFVKKGWLN